MIIVMQSINRKLLRNMQTLINGYYSCVSYWFDLHLTYIKHKTNTYENCIVDAHIQLKEDVLSKTIYFV